MAAIFIASHQPKLPDLPFLHIEVRGYDLSDKIGHLVVYAVLGALLWRVLGDLKGGVRICAVVALAVAYGITDELHQLSVPGRSFELADLGADALGAAVSSIVLTVFKGGTSVGGRTRRRTDARGKG